jgi:hypothetical protein
MTKDDEWKFCRDCKYFNLGYYFDLSLAKCLHPDSLVIKKDYIEEYKYYKDATELRDGLCGSNAIFFKKKAVFWTWIDKILRLVS